MTPMLLLKLLPARARARVLPLRQRALETLQRQASATRSGTVHWRPSDGPTLPWLRLIAAHPCLPALHTAPVHVKRHTTHHTPHITHDTRQRTSASDERAAAVQVLQRPLHVLVQQVDVPGVQRVQRACHCSCGVRRRRVGVFGAGVSGKGAERKL